MSDDPRTILADARVECPEVGEVWDSGADHHLGSVGFVEQRKAEAAILALARLVARYKWQVDLVCHDSEEFDADYLDRRWEERDEP